MRRIYQWGLRHRLGSKLVFALSIATLVSVVATYLAITGQIGAATTRPDQELGLALLVLDLVLLLLLATSVVWQIVGVWSERRRGAAGARLHVRLAMLFSLVAVAPAILVAV
ncbi:MAG: two-component sensor histidine kinase, partial [Alphaproteobacteria bacterium]